MSVIIRLQGLPWSASAMDIRQYFQGLSIPDGGVHIVGGDRGDAFIAFGSDEDARQAMLRTNGQINGQTVQLLLSSKTEMQNVIALAREAVPNQAYTKQATALPPHPPLATVPPTRPPNDHMQHPVGPSNQGGNFVPDLSVPPQRNLDYPNRRDFPPIPVDMHNTAPLNNAMVPGMIPFPGPQPANFLNQPNMPRENYFVSPEQQENKTNRPNMEFRPPDGGTNDFQNRRPNFPPAAGQDPQSNDQRRFGNANMGAAFGNNLRPAFHNFPPPDGLRNLPMPNTAMQPPDLSIKPPGSDIRPPYSTERRAEEDFGANRGNMRPDPSLGHQPGRMDYPQIPAPRTDPMRHGAGPPPMAKDMMNRPEIPRPNEPNRPDIKPNQGPPMNLGRNDLNRGDMNRHDSPTQLDMGQGHQQPNRPDMNRHEPIKQDPRRQEPGRIDMSRPEAGRNYANRSDGVRHESRFDSPRHEPPRPDPPRTEHSRSNLERMESLRQETARMTANRSDSSRPGSSGRSDSTRSETSRSTGDSGRSDSSKTDSGRHDSGRSDSGRHDSKSDSRHESRSESSSRYESSRYDSGRHDRHDRSRDEGSRYDRHERSRDDRYDRRDSRRDSRYDSRYDDGGSRHEGRYDSRRYESRHESSSSSRYDSRSESQHESSRGSEKSRSGTSSREFDRPTRDEAAKSDTPATDQHTSGPNSSQPDSYKNLSSGNIPGKMQGDPNAARKGRMDMPGAMNRGGQMNRGPTPKNDYGDNRRDYNYGPPPPDQGYSGDRQRFGDNRPPGPLDGPPPYGRPGMNEECGMYEGKPNMYEENDAMGLPRGLLGDAPPGFPGTQNEPNDGKWDEGYGMRDDMRHGNPPPRDDYPPDWHNEAMNMRPQPFPRPGAWNDMHPNQNLYPRNDGPPPFGRNDQYGRYDGLNRNDRGPPPPGGRMPMDDRNYGPPNEMNYGPPDSGMRPDNMDDNSMRGVKRGQRESDLFIEVVGLPFNVGYRDVRRFFSGCVIPRDGLKIINNEKGRRAGNAFIKFATKQNASEAFKRHGNFMGNRYIEIYSCTQEVFENAVDSYVPKSPLGPPPNKMLKTDPDNVCKDNVTPNKEMVDSNQNKMAMDAPMNPASDSSGPVAPSSSSSSVIQVKGITLNATSEDLVNFLKDVQINDPTNSIVIERDSRGKNTGIAYVEVSSPKDCNTALTLDGRYLSGRMIRINIATKKEFLALQEKEKKNNSDKTSPAKNPKDAPKTPTKTEPKTSEAGKNDSLDPAVKSADQNSLENKAGGEGKKNETITNRNTPYYCVSLRGLPFAVTLNEIKEFFQGLNIAPRGIQIVYGKDGRTTGQAFVEFVTSTDCEKAQTRDKRYIGKRYINVQAITKADMIEHIKQARQGSMPNNMDPPGPPFIMPGGKQYHYLRGENFPPSVSIGEILNFFRGYYPVPESIRLHYSDDNRPTGNSLIGFVTMDEAMKAMEDLNRKPCRKNLVTLRLA